MLWAWLSPSWRGWRSTVHIVKTKTVLAWYRHGFACSGPGANSRTGRPPVPSLILELSTANPLWDAPPVDGELQKMGPRLCPRHWVYGTQRRQRDVPTIVPETRQNGVPRANTSQLGRSGK